MSKRRQLPRHGDLLKAYVASGNEQNFEAIFRLLAPRVAAHLRSWKTSEDDLEDIVQDTLITVWRKARSYDPARGNADDWIHSICRNLAIDQSRRCFARLKALPGLRQDLHGLYTETPFDILHARECQDLLRSALESLPIEQSDVVSLSYFENLSHSEIALKEKLPLGTVKTRIRIGVSSIYRFCRGIVPSASDT